MTQSNKGVGFSKGDRLLKEVFNLEKFLETNVEEIALKPIENSHQVEINLKGFSLDINNYSTQEIHSNVFLVNFVYNLKHEKSEKTFELNDHIVLESKKDITKGDIEEVLYKKMFPEI